MKNQLAKESYAEQWEDIVRSGAASSVKRQSKTSTSSPAEDSKGKASTNGAASVPRLPAEFGTKDKVPAKGTAPMGPQDYLDGSQWTERDGAMQRRETDKDGAKADGARDRGYIGGDGANLDGAVRQQATDSAKDLASSSNGLDQQDGTSEAYRKQPQGSGQLPDQARAQVPSGNNGTGPASNKGAEQAAPPSASSNGAKPDGRKDKSASSDSDWWREVTAASKKNDCSSTASALSQTQNRQNGANGSADGEQSGGKHDVTPVQQDGAASPSSSSSADLSTARNGAGTAPQSSSGRVSSGSNTSSLSSMHGLAGHSQSTKRAPGSKNASLSPEDKADIERRTHEVKDLASKIENKVPAAKVGPQQDHMSFLLDRSSLHFQYLFIVNVVFALESKSGRSLGGFHERDTSPVSTLWQ